MLDLRREDGSALVAIVLVSVVSSMLAITALATSAGALRSAARRGSAERALHLAEAGASRGVSAVSADADYTNNVALGADSTEEDILAAAAAQPVEAGAGGEFAFLVPDGEEVAYGVGYAPSRAEAVVTRVMAVEFRLEDGAETHAVTGAGSLTMGGTASVTGLGGSVHLNGDLTLSGSAHVDGDATASGTFTLGETATVAGEHGGGYEAVTVPAVDATASRSLTNYDLCVDSTVRAHATTACTGSIVGLGTLTGWNGWTYNVLTGWTMSASSTVNGGFYVSGSSARITGSPGTTSNPWLATIVADGLVVAGLPTNGDLSITGSPKIRPWTEGVIAIARRDVTVSGSSVQLEGLVGAGEQASLTGNGKVIGSVVLAGTSNTAGSPVAGNVLSDLDIQAEFGAPIAVGGVVETRWREL